MIPCNLQQVDHYFDKEVRKDVLSNFVENYYFPDSGAGMVIHDLTIPVQNKNGRSQVASQNCKLYKLIRTDNNMFFTNRIYAYDMPLQLKG